MFFFVVRWFRFLGARGFVCLGSGGDVLVLFHF